jgi:hypothetical protein
MNSLALASHMGDGPSNPRDAIGLTTDELLAFFMDAGFLYPEKLAQMDLGGVRATLDRLHEKPSGVARATVLVNDDGIQGHVPGILVYRNTWLMQHLAARRKGEQAPSRGLRLAVIAMAQLQELPQVEWMKIYFRPTNRWPAKDESCSTCSACSPISPA